VEKSASIVVARDLQVVRELPHTFRGNDSYPIVLVHGIVEEIIAGEPLAEFHIAYDIWESIDADDFARALPATPVLLFLWEMDFGPDTVIGDLPDEGAFVLPVDGIWFRTADGDVVGGRAYVPKHEKEWDWGPIHSFDDMVQMVREAAVPAPTPTSDPGATASPPFVGRGQRHPARCRRRANSRV
jgi:hypothetical protein